MDSRVAKFARNGLGYGTSRKMGKVNSGEMDVRVVQSAASQKWLPTDRLFAEPEDSQDIDLDGNRGEQDHLHDIGMPPIWNHLNGFKTGSPKVIVANLSSGVDLNHADFEPGTFVEGYSALGDSEQDDRGNGTSSAAVINEWTNNGSLGGASIAFGVKTMPVKVINSDNVANEGDVIAGLSMRLPMEPMS